MEKNHIKEFFAQYPAFPYSAKSPVMAEFYRMVDFFDWPRDPAPPERVAAGKKLRIAITKQFNGVYGTDEKDIRSWQTLCLAIGIGIQDELEACRAAVLGSFVNLIDLVDKPGTGVQPKLFRSLDELREYTLDSGKFFPKEDAYAGGLLKFLLREIISPYEGGRTLSGGRRGRGGKRGIGGKRDIGGKRGISGKRGRGGKGGRGGRGKSRSA